MRIPKLAGAVVLMSLLSVHSANSQQLSADEKNAAIQNIAQQIAKNYVYAEKGGQIASHIQTANFKGQFNNATTWDEFDEQVTTELRNFSNDGHLYVRHDAKIVSELKDPANAAEKNNVSGHKGSSNAVVSESKILDGNVGYIKLSEININKNNLDGLNSVMQKMEGTKALIIDLRDNSGGGSDVGPVLESYFLPAGTPTLTFTQRDGSFNTDSTVNWLQEKRYEKPVYILINKNTASAAEAFAFVLQQHRRAKVVGERSAGAAYMNTWYVVNDENFVSVSTAAPSVPGRKDISWQENGVEPNIKVKKGDALEIALREAAKK